MFNILDKHLFFIFYYLCYLDWVSNTILQKQGHFTGSVIRYLLQITNDFPTYRRGVVEKRFTDTLTFQLRVMPIFLLKKMKF